MRSGGEAKISAAAGRQADLKQRRDDLKLRSKEKGKEREPRAHTIIIDIIGGATHTVEHLKHSFIQACVCSAAAAASASAVLVACLPSLMLMIEVLVC